MGFETQEEAERFAEAEEMRAEESLLALRRDAMRYRWLRLGHSTDGGVPYIGRFDGIGFSRWTNEDADRAVDEAMSNATYDEGSK